jgi:hypothetical protein
MKFPRILHASFLLVLLLTLATCPSPLATAQSTSASLTGLVDDPAKALIPGATITAINTQTGEKASTTTNKEGQYVLPGLNPGTYRVEVDKPGFKGIIEAGLTLHVQDAVQINFHMALGSSSETVTVNADQNNINTTDGSVSTVIDRQFVENMPLNGRSFQDLIALVPGVSLVPSGGVGFSGEFTVNGQRTEENYYTVDGVSANGGTQPSLNGELSGAGNSGSVAGETILGTTQSMVSIDALQEFRATTSTYSAEYGRSPGGQFSFSTRSGTNDWHGSASDYFRNTVMDANNWFNTYYVPYVPRLPEHQNDFGGTLGGPVIIPGVYRGRDKTFFFFSYEGLRLIEPQPVEQNTVPDATLRQQAPAVFAPYLNAFPMPNGGEDGLNDGIAFYNLAYSSPSSIDNPGIRIDHSFSEREKIFARYADTPSSNWTYAWDDTGKQNEAINIRTLTLGLTSAISPTQANELRLNATQNNNISGWTGSGLNGSIPFNYQDNNIVGPNGEQATLSNLALDFCLCYGSGPQFVLQTSANEQRQYNLTDSYSWLRGAHHFKFGLDWRSLTTHYPQPALEYLDYYSEGSVLANSADDVFLAATGPADGDIEPVYHNFSLFAQDEWKANSRLSLSLGLRWDLNPAPGAKGGPLPYTVNEISNLQTVQLSPENTPLWKTDYLGFAPRVGVAYTLRRVPGWETVVRTGFGMFYDTGNTNASAGYQLGIGFLAITELTGLSLPLTAQEVTIPVPSVAPPYNNAYIYGYDPNLRLPYSMQWNLAIEQALGTKQTLTLNYVGSGARKLLAQFQYNPANLGNPYFGGALLGITANRATSDYNSFQVKYENKLSHGLQALASYTYSHSIDNCSSNFQDQDLLARSSSDFDIRHNFQGALTYSIPGSYPNKLAQSILSKWGTDARFSARSAEPVDIYAGTGEGNPVTQQVQNFHPDLVPGQPLYLYGSTYPGRRIINFDAFTPAASGVEGDTPRNFARGFDAVQLNLAIRRDFPIHDRLHMQFRAEAFNAPNHPSFGGIYSSLSNGPLQFGYANSTLNNALGGLNALYQSGGPRSLQMMLKLQF